MFTIVRCNNFPIFMIVKKDAVYKNMLKYMPVEVYGLIYIYGTNYHNCTVSYQALSPCISLTMREELGHNAKLEFFRSIK